MDKNVLISEILPKLNQMGIGCTLGQGTDVTIACEFLDAGWGTGNKKINYTSSVFLNEAENTVYMWEFTKEQSSGFSFGGDSETSFQSGKTLFRKVKSIQYGPDGKAYEYSLDLGAIPKTFKETAKAHGWKFKTVLKRDKASYPPGYIPPANTNQPQPGYTPVPPVNVNPQQGHASAPPPPPVQQYQQPLASDQLRTAPVNAAPPPPPGSGQTGRINYVPQQKYADPKGAFYAQGSKDGGGKKGVFFWIGFILLALFTAVMFWYSHNSITGWAIAGLTLALLLALRKGLRKKGCLTEIIVWVAALIVIFLVFAFTTDTSPKTQVTGSEKNQSTSSEKKEQVKPEQPKAAAKASEDDAAVNKRGNTNGNIINDGIAAIQGKGIYFSYGDTLYRMSSNGTGIKAIASDARASCINVLGNWIYFKNSSDGGKIYKIGTDGKGKQKLSDTEAYNVIVVGDMIYFISNANPYKMKVDGSIATKLYDKFCQSLNVTDDNLYFQDNYSSGVAVKMKTDGSGIQVFESKISNFSLFPVSEGDWVYYAHNNDRNIYRIKNDGSGSYKLLEDRTLKLNVYGDYIYYSNENDSNKFYRSKTDGSGSAKIADFEAKSVSIVGDWIFFEREIDRTSKKHMMKTDGSGLKELAQEIQ